MNTTHTLHLSTRGCHYCRAYAQHAHVFLHNTHTHTHTHTLSLSFSLSHTHAHTDTNKVGSSVYFPYPSVQFLHAGGAHPRLHSQKCWGSLLLVPLVHEPWPLHGVPCPPGHAALATDDQAIKSMENSNRHGDGHVLLQK